MRKTCSSCGRSLPLSAYPRNGNSPDGLYCYCRECKSAKAAAYYEKNKTRVIARVRRYQDANPLRRLATMLRTFERQPNRVNLYETRKVAEAAGLLKPPSACQICGRPKAVAQAERSWHAHHFDYSQPLLVVWTCGRCHVALHRLSVDMAEPDPAQLSQAEAIVDQRTCRELAHALDVDLSTAFFHKHGKRRLTAGDVRHLLSHFGEEG